MTVITPPVLLFMNIKNNCLSLFRICFVQFFAVLSFSPLFIKTTKCCLQSFSLNFFFLVAVLCCAPVGCSCLCLRGAWQRHCSNLVAGRRAKWETLGHDASYRGPPWSLLRAYSVSICVNWRSPADQCNLMIAEETCPHLASRQQSSYASKHGKVVISYIK